MNFVDLKEVEELIVFRGAQRAGLLKRTNIGCEFQFDKEFLKDNSSGLSFHLDGRQDVYKFRGDSLPTFFAGLLPEGLRLKALISNIKTSEDDLFSILAAVGNQCVGDVYVRHPKKTGAFESNNDVAPISFKDVDFYQLLETSLAPDKMNIGNETFAGVQEKVSASMISFPLGLSKKNKSYILKLNPVDKPKLVENEFLCLSLAQKCGLDVNKAQIVKDKNSQQGLLVERFDRKASQGKDSQVIMLHQEDACQFLDRYPADKYRLNFLQVLKGIDQYATASKIEILKAMQLYAFSYLVGNGDLHAKNISLQTLKPSGKIVLTPCYDVISTYIYKDHKMAIKINGRDDNIKGSDFIELGEAFKIPAKATSLMLQKLLTLFDKNHAILFPCMNSKQKQMWVDMVKKRSLDLKKI